MEREEREALDHLESLVGELAHPAGGVILWSENLRLERAIRSTVERLLPCEGANDAEEARLCAALIEGYSQLIYERDGDYRRRIGLLRRAEKVLPHIDRQPLRCRLLIACFLVTSELRFISEAKNMINEWRKRTLTPEETAIADRVDLLWV